jgi:hypothetical protein
VSHSGLCTKSLLIRRIATETQMVIQTEVVTSHITVPTTIMQTIHVTVTAVSHAENVVRLRADARLKWFR